MIKPPKWNQLLGLSLIWRCAWDCSSAPMGWRYRSPCSSQLLLVQWIQSFLLKILSQKLGFAIAVGLDLLQEAGGLAKNTFPAAKMWSQEKREDALDACPAFKDGCAPVRRNFVWNLRMNFGAFDSFDQQIRWNQGIYFQQTCGVLWLNWIPQVLLDVDEIICWLSVKQIIYKLFMVRMWLSLR